MKTIMTYAQTRAELASLCDDVASTRELTIIYPKNATRLFTTLSRAQNQKILSFSVEDLGEERDFF